MVYLSDEKGHGERFPPELEDMINEFLAELEGRPIPIRHKHVLGHSVLEMDLESLRYFISAFYSFNSELDSQWSNLKERWGTASESWRDVKKDQFTGASDWDEVARAMEIYLTTSEQYADFLRNLEQRATSYLEA